ncbi:hypothetical protein MUA03_08115 [Enterobacteriaceae bacterium H16N7]|nr:hypothetical protein [Dryocola clanedunensis]
MTIQRYHSWNSEDDEDGHYVAYDDYAELESAHKAALLTISQITDVVGTSDTLSISQQVAKLVRRCSALAAENDWLKYGIAEACDEMEELDSGYFSTDADGEPMETLIPLVSAQAAIQKLAIDIETPATDAAIANIKAQGVDMFSSAIGVSYQKLNPGSEQAKALKNVVFLAVHFAAQLRKGAGNGQ